MEQVFSCTVQNLKRIKICETYNEIGDWNFFQYSFGIINPPTEFLIVSEISSVYVPGVVTKNSIENMTRKDSSPGEAGHQIPVQEYRIP